MDFFGVSEAERMRDVPIAASRAHTSQAAAFDDPDCPLAQPPQLSWLPDAFTWTDEECLAMLDGYLIDQLRLLGDGRAGTEVHADILAWVATPRRSTAALKEAPFSFQSCCLAAGVDFEEMRDCILRMFAPELLSLLE
jgi:hypothetical protein